MALRTAKSDKKRGQPVLGLHHLPKLQRRRGSLIPLAIPMFFTP